MSDKLHAIPLNQIAIDDVNQKMKAFIKDRFFDIHGTFKDQNILGVIPKGLAFKIDNSSVKCSYNINDSKQLMKSINDSIKQAK